MHIALYKPDIPQNTAAIIRLGACLNLKIHIIEPCGFNLHDSRFKRVVMDYMGLSRIFRYEDYNVYYIKKLCATLNISLDNNDIIDIMRELANMLNSKDIVVKDRPNDPTYQKTLLSQHHNTSNGQINKFINLSDEQLKDILKENNISTFLEEYSYF